MADLEPDTLAYKIRENRINAGFTIQRLSAVTGISYTSISKAEQGKLIPRLNNIKLIADALGVPSYIFTEADKMPEETLLQRLDKQRVMQCLSWKALARELHVDNRDLRKYAQGRKTWPALIERIVKWLDNSK